MRTRAISSSNPRPLVTRGDPSLARISDSQFCDVFVKFVDELNNIGKFVGNDVVDYIQERMNIMTTMPKNYAEIAKREFNNMLANIQIYICRCKCKDDGETIVTLALLDKALKPVKPEPVYMAFRIR